MIYDLRMCIAIVPRTSLIVPFYLQICFAILPLIRHIVLYNELMVNNRAYRSVNYIQ